ncbi:hypothetical protein MKX54_16550 [Alkalihalobacillus sp. FSL R5-0424]
MTGKKYIKKVLIKFGLIKKKQIGKIKKEIKEPFQRLGENWSSEELPVAFMFGFNPWKREHMTHFFSEYRTAYVFGNGNIQRLDSYFSKYTEKVFIIWGFKEEPEIVKYAEMNSVKLLRVEDGFVRSVGLGAAHTPPLSIAVDSQTLYFDSRGPSDLEDIINKYDFTKEENLLPTARLAKEKLIKMGVSKYNHTARTNINDIYGEKKKRRILVIGQVEDDASIRYGCSREIRNNDLVWAAYNENPDAEIIYKPHPDVLGGYRKAYSDPKEVEHISKVVTEPLGLVDALETIDHVYTITSLAGFEALIRGIDVTCFGAPFYSGWGLTDDRQEVTRRKRNVTVDELFAAAYIVYPRYLHPITNERINLEKAINVLTEMINQNTFLNGQESYKNGNVDLAIEIIEGAIKGTKSQTSKVEWILELIRILSLSKKYKKAIDLSNDFIEKYPRYINDDIFYYLGFSYEGLGEYQKAFVNYEAALNIKKKILTLEKLIQLSWEVNGPTPETITLIKEALKQKKSLKNSQLLTFSSILNQAGEFQWARTLLPTKTNIPYMSLKGLVEGNEETHDSLSARELNNRLKLSECTFESKVLQVKSDFCIVGEELSNSFQANFIDEHSLVIRVNKVDLSYPNSLYQGRKADVWFGSAKAVMTANLGNTLNQAELLLINDVNFIHSNPNAEDTIRLLFELGQKIECYPRTYYTELVEKLNKKPSESLLLLYWIYKIQGPIEMSKIIGFNFEKFNNKEKSLLNEITNISSLKYI